MNETIRKAKTSVHEKKRKWKRPFAVLLLLPHGDFQTASYNITSNTEHDSERLKGQVEANWVNNMTAVAIGRVGRVETVRIKYSRMERVRDYGRVGRWWYGMVLDAASGGRGIMGRLGNLLDYRQ
jgi:hypothetical protein